MFCVSCAPKSLRKMLIQSGINSSISKSRYKRCILRGILWAWFKFRKGFNFQHKLKHISAPVVPVHVWTHQADYVWLVRAKNSFIHRCTSDKKYHSQYLTCLFTLGRDRLTRDDAIGTTFLNLSKMSSSGGEAEGNHAIYIFVMIVVTPCFKYWCCNMTFNIYM